MSSRAPAAEPRRLEELGKQPGTLALIFGKAQNKFQDPAKLRRVIVDLIDAENWSAMGADVKAASASATLTGTLFSEPMP